MENEVKDNVIIVEENETSNIEQVEVLSPEEIELAKKHKVSIDGVVDDKVVDEKKKEEIVKEEKKTDDIPIEDLDSFEKLHDIYQNRPDSFYKLPKNIKQLYHSQKGLYKRMKDEEEKRKKVEDEVGLSKIKDSVARIKIDRIKTRLLNPEGLTVEELQELLDEKKEVESNDKPLTVKDLEAMKEKEREEENKKSDEEKEHQVAVARRIQEAEEIAKSSISDITGGKYDSFDDVVSLAQEMIKSKARYGAQIASVINSDSDVQEIVDVLVDIARLNPKWGTSEKSDKKQSVTDKESVDKLVKNAAKQATSASLTGGRGSREIHISEDMDPEEAYRVWDKIPREIRHKILKKIK